MRRRSTILLFLLVAVTIVVLLLLGVHLSGREEKMVRLRFQELAERRLADLDATALGVLGEVERNLLELTQSRERSPETLRGWVRKNPLVRQVFWVDAESQLLHPVGPELSLDEREFVRRTESIWRQQAVLHAPALPEQTGVGQAQRTASFVSRGSGGDSLASLAARKNHGFVSWYWEEGLHLLFWRRDESGGVIGVEVERIVLLSRIVARLPSGLEEEGRVSLADARGETVYQWGEHEPAEAERPLAERTLASPLDSFRLRFHPSPRQLADLESSGLPWVLGLSGLALSLLVFFSQAVREHRSALVEAEKRVGFVTRVSHELKTPLTNIRLYAELLEDALSEDGKAERHRQVILEESERLGRLIGNVLTFSKSEREVDRLRLVSLPPDEQLRRVAEQFRPALERRGFVLELDLDAPQPIRVDPDAFDQIFGNLLGNAEKYGAAGRFVGLRSRQDSRVTCIEVEDRGPGVQPGLREQIFQPFYRGSDRMDEGVTGTGIGLTIARELARRMGGDLVCLAGKDSGSCFRLTLPTASQPDEGGRT